MATKGIPDDASDLSLFSAFVESLPSEMFLDQTARPEGGSIVITLSTDEEKARFPPGVEVVTVTNSLSGLTLRVRVYTDCLDGKLCNKVQEALIFNLNAAITHIESCAYCQQFAQKQKTQSNSTETS